MVPDADEPGRRHALKVARSLMPIVERLKVVELPDLQEKQDVSDWLAAGHSKEELLSIVEAWLSGGRGGTRTPDLLVRSQTLYPTELHARGSHCRRSPEPPTGAPARHKQQRRHSVPSTGAPESHPPTEDVCRAGQVILRVFCRPVSRFRRGGETRSLHGTRLLGSL